VVRQRLELRRKPYVYLFTRALIYNTMKLLVALVFVIAGYICFIAGAGYIVSTFFIMIAAYFLLEPLLSEPEETEVSIATTFTEVPPKDSNGTTIT